MRFIVFIIVEILVFSKVQSGWLEQRKILLILNASSVRSVMSITQIGEFFASDKFVNSWIVSDVHWNIYIPKDLKVRFPVFTTTAGGKATLYPEALK